MITRGRGWLQKGCKEILERDITILYLDCGEDYMSLCACQNSQNCTQKHVNFTYINYTSINLNQKGVSYLCDIYVHVHINICVHVHISTCTSTCVCICIYNRHVHIHILNSVCVIYLKDFLRRYTKIFTESITGVSLFFSFLFSNTVNSHEVVQ